jgi:hypothetical protein
VAPPRRPRKTVRRRGIEQLPDPLTLTAPGANRCLELADRRQLAAVAGAALDDVEPPLDFEADDPLDFEADDDVSLADSVEVVDFFFSPSDEVLPDPARLSVR